MSTVQRPLAGWVVNLSVSESDNSGTAVIQRGRLIA